MKIRLDERINKSFIKGLYAGFIIALLFVSITQCFYYVKQSDLNKINSILNIVSNKYIEIYTKEEIIDGLTKGIFTNLDGYSTYLTKADFEDFISTENNNFCGIGIRWQKNEDGYCELLRVYENGPAFKAGLKKGDILLTINNYNLSALSKEEITTKIRGLEDTYLDITLIRNNEEYSYSVKREFVHIPLVTCDIENNIGLIAIESFDGDVVKDFNSVLKEIDENNIQDIIVDLRNNTGGNVDLLREIVSNLIVKDSLLFKLIEKDGTTISYDVLSKTNKNYNIVILVNKYTASCSEIMAGMFQDFGLATIIGEQTYGKGVVQECIVLEDGSAIFLTTGKYILPSGRYITDDGLKPDIIVEDKIDTDVDEQLEKAKEIFKRD